MHARELISIFDTFYRYDDPSIVIAGVVDWRVTNRTDDVNVFLRDPVDPTTMNAEIVHGAVVLISWSCSILTRPHLLKLKKIQDICDALFIELEDVEVVTNVLTLISGDTRMVRYPAGRRRPDVGIFVPIRLDFGGPGGEIDLRPIDLRPGWAR